jgi:hypothetical protein
VKRKLIYITLLVMLISTILFAYTASADELLQNEPNDDILIENAKFGQFGGFSTMDEKINLTSDSQPPSNLSRQDYQNIYDRANKLRQRGVRFRRSEIQLLPSGEISRAEDIKNNYENFNGGDLYYRFCYDYTAIDQRGYCPNARVTDLQNKAISLAPSVTDDDINIRNKMLDARSLFLVLLIAEPIDLKVQVIEEQEDGTEFTKWKNAREVGREGILEITREIAHIHITFGNEFLVDAIDYRFGGLGLTAERLFAEEFGLLTEAQNQFDLASRVLLDSFNANIGWPNKIFVADMFTPHEFEVFAIATESLVTALDQQTIRHRQQRNDGRALGIYQDAFITSYLQSAALAQNVTERCNEKVDKLQPAAEVREESINQCIEDYTATGGPLLLSSLELLRNRSQIILNGINPFGFTDKYVPLQTYDAISQQAQQFLSIAAQDEGNAFHATRDFDQLATTLRDRLQDIAVTYDTPLLQICGTSSDDMSGRFETCMNNYNCDVATLANSPGELKQNYCSLVAAEANIDLIDQQISNLTKTIEIEINRITGTITLTLEGAEQQGAIEIAKGIEESTRTTHATVKSKSSTRSWGNRNSVRAECSGRFDFNLLDWSAGCGGSVTAEGYYNFDWANADIKSTSTIVDDDAEKLAELTKEAILKNAEIQVRMEQNNRDARIFTWLLEEATLAINKRAATAEYNRLIARHNHLTQQYHHWKNLRAMAEQNEVESYLNNPIYRILREDLTIQASLTFRVAAQYAYLAAKALEYEFLIPLDGTYDIKAAIFKPNIDHIFRARTTIQVQTFLDSLETYRNRKKEELGVYGRHATPYAISIKEDVFLLGEDDRDSFSAALQKYYDAGTNVLRIPFVTTLAQFDTNLLWNHRIAPINGDPNLGCSNDCNGLAVSIEYSGGHAGRPLVRLEHGGVETFLDRNGNIVEYSPGNVGNVINELMVDYSRSISMPNPIGGTGDKLRAATVTAGINCDPLNMQTCGSRATAELFNLSPAASAWYLIIDFSQPSNNNLRLDRIDNIIIYMDVTRISRPTH